MKTLAIVGLILCAGRLGSGGVAHADTDTERSPALAVGLSLAGVAASVATAALAAKGSGETADLIAVGGAASLVLTPSLGHFYAGEYLTTGLVLRAAGAGLFGLGVGCVFRCSVGATYGLLVTGLAGVAVGTIVDVVTAADTARAWNARHGLTVTPTAISTTTGRAYGVGLSGRF